VSAKGISLMNKAFGADKRPYLLVTTATVTIAQASALFLVVQAYGVNRFSIAILVVSVVVSFRFFQIVSDQIAASMT
jgi:hypothetical protein